MRTVKKAAQECTKKRCLIFREPITPASDTLRNAPWISIMETIGEQIVQSLTSHQPSSSYTME